MLLLQKNSKSYRVFAALQWACLCLFTATLWYRRDINQACLIAALFFSLFLFDSGLFKKNFKITLALCATYLVSIASVAYSANRHEALFVLEKQMTLALVPLIFSFSFSLDAQRLKVVLHCFIISLFAACVYLLCVFYHHYEYVHKSESFQVFLEHNMHHDFSKPIGMHATYMGMYVCFAIAYCAYALFKQLPLYKLIAFICLAVFGTTFILLSSRILFVSFSLIMLGILPFFLSKRQLFIYTPLLLLASLCAYHFFSRSEAFKERFKNDTYRELNIKNAGDSALKTSDDATRAERWRCAMELIKERPLAGYGTGGEKSMLSLKYAEHHLATSYRLNFDAHNQYFSFMIKSGIFGLLSYMLMLGCSLYLAFIKKNYMHLVLLAIIITASFTENILESNKGILFFAIFNTLMAYLPAPKIRTLG